MDYILSVDLGTTAIKILLFETNGTVLAKSTQEYVLLTPSALEVELSVETYWNAFKRGLAEVMTGSKADPSRIRAMRISAQVSFPKTHAMRFDETSRHRRSCRHPLVVMM